MADSSAQHGSIPRRDLLRLALRAGISIPAIAALVGCEGEGSGALGEGRSADGDVTELIVPTHRSPWLDAYSTVAARYSEETGVRVTLREFPYDGLRTQMTNAIQGGNQTFDLYQLDEPWVAQFYDNDWVVPLTELDSSLQLDPEVLTYADLPFWNAAQKVFDQDGQLMGLPLNGNLHLLMYRTDLYEELGLTVPATWEEAVANGRQAQQAGTRYGYVARAQATIGGQSITYEFMPVFYSYGGSWFVDEGVDWTPAVNTDAAVTAMETYKEILSLGPAQPQTIGQAEVISLMQGGESLQTHVVAAAAAQLEDPDASRVAGRIGYAVVPAGSTGEPAPTSGTWSLCIPAGLPENRARAALDFIQWLLDKDAQLQFTQAGGIPTRSDTLQSPDVPESSRAYLAALADSMPNVRPAARYSFSTPMLEVTERILGEIAAGSLPVRGGLDQLQEELVGVVRDAGLLR